MSHAATVTISKLILTVRRSVTSICAPMCTRDPKWRHRRFADLFRKCYSAVGGHRSSIIRRFLFDTHPRFTSLLFDCEKRNVTLYAGHNNSAQRVVKCREDHRERSWTTGIIRSTVPELSPTRNSDAAHLRLDRTAHTALVQQ